MITLLCVLFLYRAVWLSEARLTLLDLDYYKYRKLPSQMVMLLKFWVWDIQKFVKDE